jgi:hypothetical protein
VWAAPRKVGAEARSEIDDEAAAVAFAAEALARPGGDGGGGARGAAAAASAAASADLNGEGRLVSVSWATFMEAYVVHLLASRSRFTTELREVCALSLSS